MTRKKTRPRLSRALFQALLAAHREARRARGARQPTRHEVYQALLDASILTDDPAAMAWFDRVEPVPEAPPTPVPLRAMLRRIASTEGAGREVRLLDLARLITGDHPRPRRRGPHTNQNLPMAWTGNELVVQPPPPPPPAPVEPPEDHAHAFHCPECCPRPRARASGQAKRSAVEEAEAFLASVGGELTAEDRLDALDPARGRASVMDRVLEAMLMMHRPNPILVGPSGVGKSTILEGLARRILQGDCPPKLVGTRIFRLDANLFRSQAGIIGRIEEFLEKIVHALELVGPAVLAIDEVHLLVGTGAHKDDPKGAEQYLREHMSRGRLRILGTTSPGEYERFLAEDRAFAARVVKIPVEEPDLPLARRMVRYAARRMEAHYEVRIPPALADRAAGLVTRFPTGTALPLAAVDLLDWALARASARGRDPEEADLEESLASLLGCDVAHIRQEGSRKIRTLRQALGARVKGQDEAVDEVVAALGPYCAGLKEPRTPAAVLLLAGPTGVGKTETARQVARHLFGSQRKLVRVPMADLTDSFSSTRLLGAGPGYVGHDKGGWLVRRLRETPSCVLLLDEFDRAHPAVRDVFLEAFDNARLVDSRGLEADLRHVLVILTSNLGATGTRTPGFQGDQLASERARLVRVMKEGLSDALVGRLSAIIPYSALSEAAMLEILDLKLRALEKRLGLRDGRVVLQADLQAQVLKRGFAPATGARGLDEALQRLVIRPLSARILEQGLPGDADLLHLGVGGVEG